MTPVTPTLPRFAPPPNPRFCQDADQEARYVELAQRVYRKHAPVSYAEVTLANDILVATWLLHFWKIRCANLRKNYRTLREQNPEAPELAAIRAEREHGERQACAQTYFLSRRRRLYAELRVQYERALAEAGYTLQDAREAFLADRAETRPPAAATALPEAA